MHLNLLSYPTPASASASYRSATTLKRLTEVYRAEVADRGGRGLDRVSAAHFEQRHRTELKVVFRKARDYSYSLTPFLETLLPRGRGRAPRLISLPTVRDRVFLAALKRMLHDVFPEAVHRTLPNAHVRAIRRYIEDPANRRFHFFRADIKGFYDNVDHDVLHDRLASRIRSNDIRRLVMRAVTNPTVPFTYSRNQKQSYVPSRGVPQGLSISNVLANLYLKSTDEAVVRVSPVYHRYVDDILIVGSAIEVSAAREALVLSLASVGLELNTGKSYHGDSDDAFEFLGYKFADGIVGVRDKTVAKFVASLAGRFTQFRETLDAQMAARPWLNLAGHKEVFVEELNLAITGAISQRRRYGWLFYFLEISDRALLHQIDAIVSSFFQRSPHFGRRPTAAKRLARAYFEAKHRPAGGYLMNYDNMITIGGRSTYLKRFGLLDPTRKYSAKEIAELFERTRSRHLFRLELDLGRMS